MRFLAYFLILAVVFLAVAELAQAGGSGEKRKKGKNDVAENKKFDKNEYKANKKEQPKNDKKFNVDTEGSKKYSKVKNPPKKAESQPLAKVGKRSKRDASDSSIESHESLEVSVKKPKFQKNKKPKAQESGEKANIQKTKNQITNKKYEKTKVVVESSEEESVEVGDKKRKPSQPKRIAKQEPVESQTEEEDSNLTLSEETEEGESTHPEEESQQCDSSEENCEEV